MRRRLTLAAVAFGVAAAIVPALAAAECEPVLPTASITAGMTGTGMTVAQGTTPESFDVEVLGVLANGIAPGRDLIVVDTSSATIDEVGGIWAGISGSPVYIGGEFAGTVSYGLTAGPSSLAGLTPAEDVAALVDLPATAAIRRLDEIPASVRLPAGLARAVARHAGISAQAAAGFTQLKIPLSVSGLGTAGLRRMSEDFAKENKPFIPYAGGSVSRSTLAADPFALEAGDNFAATVSYGDMTIAAIGTTSYVCDGKAIAFGHPATFEGDVTLGANEADALTIAPETLGAPYKLASVGGLLGSLDQDRLAGVRGVLGEMPASMPIRTRTRVPHLSRTRDGATDVVPQDWAGSATFYHLWANYDATYDSGGRGSATSWFVFEGTRADGSPWRLSRGNRFASPFASSDIAFEIAILLEILQTNPYEEVDVSRVNVSTTFDRRMLLYRFAGVTISKNGGPFRSVSEIRARPGTRFAARVVLKPNDGAPNKVVTLPFRVPRDVFPEGYLFLTGGSDADDFFFDEEEGGADSFDGLLDLFQTADRNDVLSGRLLLSGGDEEFQERSVRRHRTDRVIEGGRFIRIRPAGRG